MTNPKTAPPARFDAAKKRILKKSKALDSGLTVEGYDFSRPFDFRRFLAAYETTGFQATNLAQAIRIFRRAREEHATLF